MPAYASRLAEHENLVGNNAVSLDLNYQGTGRAALVVKEQAFLFQEGDELVGQPLDRRGVLFVPVIMNNEQGRGLATIVETDGELMMMCYGGDRAKAIERSIAASGR